MHGAPPSNRKRLLLAAGEVLTRLEALRPDRQANELAEVTRDLLVSVITGNVSEHTFASLCLELGNASTDEVLRPVVADLVKIVLASTEGEALDKIEDDGY